MALLVRIPDLATLYTANVTILLENQRCSLFTTKSVFIFLRLNAALPQPPL